MIVGATTEPLDGAARPSSTTDRREATSQLYGDALAKVTRIFGKHLADVLERHRRVETLTGERNVIGRQNLVEALAHLSVLFTRAPDLDRDEQLEQVAYLGDHLRRVMMEAFEKEVYVAIASLWDDEDKNSVGRRYGAVAAPQIRRGKLLGHVQPDDVDRRFDAIVDGIVAARRAKVADEDWAAWATAADEFEDAARGVRDLQREMGAAVDAAEQRRSQWWFMGIGAVISAAIGVGLTIAVQALT